MENHTEEFLEEQKRTEAEMDKFLADDRTIRFETTDYNFSCLSDFLDQHGLEVNHRNLLFAYDSLQDTLDLTPFAEPIPAEPQPVAAPPPAQAPAPTPPTAPQARRVAVGWRNGKPLDLSSARSL